MRHITFNLLNLLYPLHASCSFVPFRITKKYPFQADNGADISLIPERLLTQNLILHMSEHAPPTEAACLSLLQSHAFYM